MTRALIVVGNNYDRERYKNILQDMDLEVTDKPRTGVEAQQIYRVMKPEIVILDLMISGTSGLDLLRLMKNDFDGSTILFLTGVDSRNVMERAFRLRAEDILVKPFSDAEFASTVLHAKKNQEARSQFLPVS